MLNRSRMAGAAVAGLLALLAAPPAQAQATRTFVSGVGDDVNPCSRTAPCHTFAGAISKTAAGGEIDTLDPGGFGAVTITKAMTIAQEGTGVAGILVAGTNGITINCATDPNCVVNIRGLQIDGGPVGSNSLSGIRFVAGKALQIQNCIIRNFTGGSPNGYGVNFNPNGPAQLDISDTVISTNGQQGAGSGVGAGIYVAPQAGGSAKVTINRVELYNNANGIRFDNTSAAAPMVAVIRDTIVSTSASQGVALANPGTGTPQKVTVMLDHVASVGNAADGLVVNGLNTIANVNNSQIQGNGNHGFNIGANGGTINTFKNNAVIGNANDNTGVATPVTPN
jgi:hypothetical protein